jgi:hypothetical protein
MNRNTDTNTGDVNPVPHVTVGTKYRADRALMLDAIRVRWGMSHRSDVVKVALDRLLVDEGCMVAPEAA